MNWNLEKLMDYAQVMAGLPINGFYNIEYRRDIMNQAQREMVLEAKALFGIAAIDLSGRQGVVPLSDPLLEHYLFPADQMPYVADSLGTHYTLEFRTPFEMDVLIPRWTEYSTDTRSFGGYPKYLINYQRTFRVFPIPESPYTLHLPFVKAPDDMEFIEDTPFDGDRALNQYAVGLAHRAAFHELLGLDTTKAYAQNRAYREEKAKMNTHIRETAGGQSIQIDSSYWDTDPVLSGFGDEHDYY